MATTSLSLLNRLQSHAGADAWDRLVRVYTPLIYGWLRKYYLQSADAEELVQEVMIVVVRKLPAFQHNGQRGAFRRWMLGILRNCLHDFWRARAREPAGSGESDFAERLDALAQPDSEMSRCWDRDHDQHVLRRLLDQIRPDFQPSTWQAFCGVVLEERPANTVARELGITRNAVYCAKAAVLRRLRQEAKQMVD
jgi:RNA polymerase sigma-70 factor (ECF subfamily)